ncbi:MAG: hypothetical protein WDW36_008407 [Sanguina aurantia]
MGKYAFFEICSGTGAMSAAATIVKYDRAFTMDILPSMEPDFECDITDPTTLEPVVAKISELKSKGYWIVFHFSPPCNAYSRMQLCHAITPADLRHKIAQANKLVNAGLAFATLHGDAWSLENPRTGTLWTQPEGTFVCSLAHRVDLDYCQYGASMMKATSFAFSCPELRDAFGVGKLCNPLTCDSMFLNESTGHMVHQSIESIADYRDRILIPGQVGMKVTEAVKAYLRTLPPLADSPAAAPALPAEGMRARKEVIAYRVLRRGVAEFLLTGSKAYSEMGADAALEHPWADILLLRAFCAKVNTYKVKSILERKGDQVLVEWRDYEEPTWEPAAQYKGWS